jgi:hypothetical protein
MKNRIIFLLGLFLVVNMRIFAADQYNDKYFHIYGVVHQYIKTLFFAKKRLYWARCFAGNALCKFCRLFVHRKTQEERDGDLERYLQACEKAGDRWESWIKKWDKS